MKQCFKCQQTKPADEFYVNKRMADGRLGKCKECTKRDARENYRANRDYYREYERKRANLAHRIKARQQYAQSASGRASQSASKARWSHRNPDKRAAHHIVNNAIRDGRLKKMPCEVCGATYRIHGHHDDYARPLDVMWLCAKHHAQRHRELREAEIE